MQKNCIIVIILITFYCTPIEGKGADQKPLIVTSMKPVASVVSQLVGEYATVVPLFKGVESVHHAYLRPSQMRVIAEADLVLLIHKDYFEITLGKAFDTNDNRVLNIADMEDITLLPYRNINDDHYHSHDHHDGHNNYHSDSTGMYDYHLWIDIDNMEQFANHIADELVKLLPDHKNVILDNLNHVNGRFKALKRKLSDFPKDFTPQHYLIWHDSIQYIEDTYKLKEPFIVSTSHSGTISARRVQEVRQNIEKHNIKCVVQDTDFNDKMVQLLTENMPHTITTVPIDIKGALIPYDNEHYFNLMLELSEKMTKCVGN